MCQRSLARHGNFHVYRNPVVSGSVVVACQGYNVAAGAKLGPGLGVPLIGVALAVSANCFVQGDFNLVRLARCNPDRPAIIRDAQAALGRERLFQAFVVTIGMAEERQVAIIDLDVVAQPRPVQARRLGGGQAADDQHHQQDYASGADAARPETLALIALVLAQLDQAPQDDQGRPVLREDASQRAPVQHADVGQQQRQADDDQNHGTGKRSWSFARWLRRYLHRASHCAPHSKKRNFRCGYDCHVRCRRIDRSDFHVPGVGDVALQNLDQADDDQQRGQRTPEANDVQAVEQELHPESQQDGWPHQATHAAALAGAEIPRECAQ